MIMPAKTLEGFGKIIKKFIGVIMLFIDNITHFSYHLIVGTQSIGLEKKNSTILYLTFSSINRPTPPGNNGVGTNSKQ